MRSFRPSCLRSDRAQISPACTFRRLPDEESSNGRRRRIPPDASVGCARPGGSHAAGRTGLDARLLAGGKLPLGRPDLSLRQPLLRKPLELAHVKPLVVGHWGTTPGQNFIYAHLNRVIKQYGLDMFYVAGPGHGGPALVANTYLEGTYSEIYPDISQDEAGLKRLFTQFSFPGGISSHVAPSTPGSIHEGGELGYSLSHAFGAVFDNPDLIVACVVGDGEAETGPLATAWHSNKFLDLHHRRRGAADPASERLQDQQPHRAGADRATRSLSSSSAAAAGSPISSKATIPTRCTSLWRPPSTTRSRRSSGSSRRTRDRPARASALADDRAALAERLDRAEDGGRAGRSKARSARIRCR